MPFTKARFLEYLGEELLIEFVYELYKQNKNPTWIIDRGVGEDWAEALYMVIDHLHWEPTARGHEFWAGVSRGDLQR
jgi:hypothetical protein